MDSPPPGYNPGDSLLQGGNAPIHPVMGGGGMVGGAYEDQSLLRGGENAPIHAVSGGGGRDQKAIEIKDVVLKGATDENINIIQPLSEMAFKAFEDLSKEYVVRTRDSSGIWKRYGKKGAPIDESPRLMTVGNCGVPPKGVLDDINGQAGFDRLVLMIPKDTKQIIVMPRINGDMKLFIDCIAYLRDEKLNLMGPVSKAFIFFPPPFYSMAGSEENRRLAGLVYHLKKGDFPNLYVMAQPTLQNKIIGCMMSGTMPDLPVLNMLEPTYAVYPYARDLNEPSALDKSGSGINYRVGGLIFSAAGGNEALLPVSNLPSRIASVSDQVRGGRLTSMALPPNPAKEDAEINLIYPSFKMRFLNEPVAKKFPEGIVRHFILQGEERAADKVPLDPVLSNVFRPTTEEELALDGVRYTRVPLGPNIFTFRRPVDPKDPKDPVKIDWDNNRYTQDEANFLNELNLRVDILEAIFPGEWRQRLSEFLFNVVNSRCFTDERLLTRHECMRTREFVQAVFNWFMMHDERIAKLADDEAKARRRDLQVRMKTAIDEAEEEAAAGERARKQLSDELAEIQKKATAAGVDLAIDLESYKKNPFTDGVLKTVGRMMGSTKDKTQKGGNGEAFNSSDILENVDDPSKRTIIVLAQKKDTGEYQRAQLNFTVDEEAGEEEENKADQAVLKINEEFPGWSVFK